MKNNKSKKLLMTATILSAALFSVSPAQAQGAPQDGNQRKGPPQEAYTACDSKETEESCTVTTPRGEMTGTCKDPKGDSHRICVPSGHKGEHQRNSGAPAN